MNIKKEIIRATSHNILWPLSEFYEVLEILKQNGIGISYWEDEENWAGLIIEKQTIGYIWKKYSIMFIVREYFEIVYEYLQNKEYLSIIKVESLTSKELILEKPLLKRVFNIQFENDFFSVDDLWFNTNT